MPLARAGSSVCSQADQAPAGDCPGQHEGCCGEASDGVDHVGAQEGTDEGQHQADDQAGNGDAVLVLLSKDLGHHAAAGHGHQQVCGSHEEAVPGGEQTGDSADGDQPVQNQASGAGEQELEHGGSCGTLLPALSYS